MLCGSLAVYDSGSPPAASRGTLYAIALLIINKENQMKYFLFLAGLFFGVLLLYPIESQAQWQSDVRLTNNAALSLANQYTNGRCIASSGDTVHVVWYDNRDGGNFEIYYKRSLDGGINWGADTRVSNNIYFSSYPSVAVSGSVVHIVWQDNRDGNYEIYYNRSTDGGTTWGTDTRLTNESAASETPCISASGPVVHIVWQDNRVQGGAYYKSSSDGGISWGADTRIKTDTVGGSWGASVSASGLLVHVLWLDGRNEYQNVFYKRSTDGGLNWGADTPLTNNDSTHLANNPSVTVSGSNVHVLWMESPRDTFAYQLYYKHSTDGGITWGADTQLTTNYTSASLHSVITSSGSNVHMVWDDNRNSALNYEIYYKGSTNGGIDWGSDTRLTNDSSSSAYPFVSASGTAVHVVWMDLRDGNYEIYYKRNPTGNVTGVENSDPELPGAFNLEQNYPNPFNPSSTIKFQIPGSGYVTLVVYNVLGKEVSTLISEQMEAGIYTKQFDAKDLSSGVYFYQLKVGNPSSGSGQSFVETKKLILMK